MTNKGIAILSAQAYNVYLYYFSSICSSKSIFLYPNELKEFPMKDFIIPGLDQYQFSFVEIDEDLKIYKNANEVQIGQIFYDLNNFTYFLKIENIIKKNII